LVPRAPPPRKLFDPDALADLADSIQQHGIIQPLTVRKLQSGYYQIIAGERRWRAARMAGLTQVPAVVIEADDRKAMELAMIENLQREDLNPIEEAEGYKVLMEQYNMTQEETAKRVGKSRPAVANALRLLNLLSLHGASPEQIEGGILGSVVPALTGRVLAALQMLCPVRILTVGPGLKSGIRLRLDNPAQLGAELLCGAVAALAEGSGPLVVISADTAISLMAVNGKQELVGGVILPGPQLSLAALVQNTAQLPQIDLSAPAPASVLGKNTAACLQNGFVLGTAGMLDGLADHFCAELGPETKFYATGNLPTAIRDACRTPILYRETLITDGLYCIWLRNRR